MPVVDLLAKVAFLSGAGAFPEGTGSVERIETHMSWVFLTDRRAYKLKKPVRTSYLDYRDVDARRRYCEEEVRCNARLAPGVYLGVVALTASDGVMALGGGGEIIDWLVVMRRLPGQLVLSAAISAGRVRDADVLAVADLLAAFYARATRTGWTAAEYRRRLDAAIAEVDVELRARGLDAGRVRRISAAQRAALERSAPVLDGRIADGRVVDAHGDLRPEHIFLEDPPVIIDCLEFAPDLRVLDAVSELSFLHLECGRLGAAALGRLVIHRYGDRTGDRPPPALLALYRAQHACVRALVAARHLDDGRVDADRWRARTSEYLELAAQAQRLC